MKNVVIGILLAAASLPAWPQPPLVPCIRQVDYVVQTLDGETSSRENAFLFVLYIGNSETECRDRLAERAGIVKTVCLVHPAAPVDGKGAAPEAASRAPAARNGWYVTEVDTERCLSRRGPLLDRALWQSIPLAARQAYVALGPEDRNLVLISWNGLSGSVSIYFAPAVQADRPFFERKLGVLRRYLEEHGQETDLPFERVDPSGPAGLFTSS